MLTEQKYSSKKPEFMGKMAGIGAASQAKPFTSYSKVFSVFHY
jgi:hypothetical protein